MIRSTPSLLQSLEGQNSTLAARSGEKDAVAENNVQHKFLPQFSPILLLLTFLVVLVTTGIGATMIFWFVTHTRQGGLLEIWREGAFLLDEGTQSEGDFEAARLAGLTIASAAVSSVLTTFSQRSNDEQTIAMNTAMPILLSITKFSRKL